MDTIPKSLLDAPRMSWLAARAEQLHLEKKVEKMRQARKKEQASTPPPKKD